MGAALKKDLVEMLDYVIDNHDWCLGLVEGEYGYERCPECGHSMGCNGFCEGCKMLRKAEEMVRSCRE